VARAMPVQAAADLEAAQSTPLPPPAAAQVGEDSASSDATEPVANAGLEAVVHHSSAGQIKVGCLDEQLEPEPRCEEAPGCQEPEVEAMEAALPQSVNAVPENAAPEVVPPIAAQPATANSPELEPSSAAADPLATEPVAAQLAAVQPAVAAQAGHPGTDGSAATGAGGGLGTVADSSGSTQWGMCRQRRRSSQGTHQEQSPRPASALWSGLSLVWTGADS